MPGIKSQGRTDLFSFLFLPILALSRKSLQKGYAEQRARTASRLPRDRRRAEIQRDSVIAFGDFFFQHPVKVVGGCFRQAVSMKTVGPRCSFYLDVCFKVRKIRLDVIAFSDFFDAFIRRSGSSFFARSFSEVGGSPTLFVFIIAVFFF